MTTPCPTCAALGDAEIANTGRDERLSPAWQQMTRLELASQIDLGICPGCGALFEWSDHPQFFGSGNLDEERLRRLEGSEAALVRALLGGGDDPATALAALGPALAGGVAPELLAEILRHLLRRHRPLFQRMLVPLLDALHATPPFDYSLLATYACWSHVRSRELAGLIEADPRPRPPAVAHLLQACRKQLATPE